MKRISVPTEGSLRVLEGGQIAQCIRERAFISWIGSSRHVTGRLVLSSAGFRAFLSCLTGNVKTLRTLPLGGLCFSLGSLHFKNATPPVVGLEPSTTGFKRHFSYTLTWPICWHVDSVHWDICPSFCDIRLQKGFLPLLRLEPPNSGFRVS